MNWLELAKGRHSIAPDFPDVAFLHSLGRTLPLIPDPTADFLTGGVSIGGRLAGWVEAWRSMTFCGAILRPRLLLPCIGVASSLFARYNSLIDSALGQLQSRT
jgi:hypothetical protein